MTILAVEDNYIQRSHLEKYFIQQGYQIRSASSLTEADKIVDTRYPDLIILDWMLPDGSGLQWMQLLRGRGYNGWILMLTARADSTSILAGLHAGADDYVSKPFRIKELEARVAVGLRRCEDIKLNSMHSGLVTIGDLVIDREHNKVLSTSGTLVRLTFLEYSLVLMLGTAHPGFVSREVLTSELCPGSYSQSYNSLHNIVYRVRNKLVDAGVTKTKVRSEYKKGYTIAFE
ncbi:response regulator transcription factor [bacterium]|nr:response regulator transcription factor [bacterium]